MKYEVAMPFVRVLIEVVNSVGIEKGSSSFDPVNNVSLFQKKFGEIRSVLSSNPSNNCSFHTFLLLELVN